MINKKREGLWVEKYALDTLQYKSIGNYKNNEPTKKWRYYLDGKLIKKEKYKARFCKTKSYHQNGQLQSKGKTVLDTSGKYAHWYYQGEWKFYDNKGKLLSRSTYKEGELTAEKKKLKN
ncbi:hypothetical protein [Flavobacterium sp.]|uniref:hypothetical protein n=1 Tax=Flavobacterium sp. TaxID=239 RepID=UPI00261A9ADD|nr:hypothetical protein [Flavobacterium sp.]MDG2431712.1 hypothetical protein [Flavobacterium sp.]